MSETNHERDGTDPADAEAERAGRERGPGQGAPPVEKQPGDAEAEGSDRVNPDG